MCSRGIARKFETAAALGGEQPSIVFIDLSKAGTIAGLGCVANLSRRESFGVQTPAVTDLHINNIPYPL